MTTLHPLFQKILASHGMPQCKRCEEFDEIHDQNCPEHPDYDPTPWCNACGARKRSSCKCGPIAENE